MGEAGQIKRALIDATAGAISGAVARTVTSPLDVIKIRFQVQLEPTTQWALLRRDVYGPSKYTGMLQATKDIFREEGFLVYPNMRSALSNILETRGLRGLYAGLAPTLVEIVPYAGLQFGTYDTFKRWTMAWNRSTSRYPGRDNDVLTDVEVSVCGLAAGICAKAVCHPLDVVKKRFQVQGLQRDRRYGARVEPRAYRNMHDAVVQILRAEGSAGLYKGIVPSVIKAAPATAVTFVAFEFASKWLKS